MQRELLGAEFQHVAEKGDPPAAADPADAVLGRGGGEDLERRRHRRGVGVVALVDQRDRAVEAAGPIRIAPARAAAVRGAPVGQRQGGAGDVAADGVDRRQHGERVHREVPARRRKLEDEPRAVRTGPGAGAVRRHRRLEQRELGPSGRAEAHRARAGPLRRREQDRIGRDVARQDRRAAGLQPGRRSRPSRGRCRRGSAKAARCAAATVVTIATCGRASACQRRDLAGWFIPISITAKSAAGAASAPASAARPSGCCSLPRRHGSGPAPPAPRAASPWSPVLPTEPVTATTRPATRARAARPSASRAVGTSGTTRSGASGARPSGTRDTSAAAAPLASACADEVVAVARRRQRDEQVARARGCGCRSTRRSPPSRACRFRPWPRPPRRGPERARRRLRAAESRHRHAPAHPARPPPRSPARRRRTAARRRRRPGRSRGPCPRPAARRPGPARRRRVRIASARSPISVASGHAARIAARIAAGFSDARVVVGHEHHIGAARAAAPISGRLPAVAVAAGAEHHESRPITCGRSAASAVASASGRVGVVDKHRGAVARASPPAASGRARSTSRGSASSTALGVGARRDGEPGRDQRVLRLERRRSARAAPCALRPCQANSAAPARWRRALARRCAASQSSARPTVEQPQAPRPRAASATSGAVRIVEIDHRRRRPRGSTRVEQAAAWRRNRPPVVRDSRDGRA